MDAEVQWGVQFQEGYLEFGPLWPPNPIRVGVYRDFCHGEVQVLCTCQIFTSQWPHIYFCQCCNGLPVRDDVHSRSASCAVVQG
jgi:hypothetical protein